MFSSTFSHDSYESFELVTGGIMEKLMMMLYMVIGNNAQVCPYLKMILRA